jgi:hypothetical protein
MKITQCTRDHRETFTSATLGSCETFVGNDYHACELGVDDLVNQINGAGTDWDEECELKARS